MSEAEREQLAVLRFFLYVEKTESCWFWRGSVDRRGYGKTWFNRGMMFAHRRAWEIANGKIPNGLCVCHACDTPLCVNPVHLWLGDRRDNNVDRSRKGRGVYGVSNHKTKIPDEEIPIILEDLASGATLRSLGNRYGVSKRAILYIRNTRAPALRIRNPVLFSRTQTTFLESGGNYNAG